MGKNQEPSLFFDIAKLLFAIFLTAGIAAIIVFEIPMDVYVGRGEIFHWYLLLCYLTSYLMGRWGYQAISVIRDTSKTGGKIIPLSLAIYWFVAFYSLLTIFFFLADDKLISYDSSLIYLYFISEPPVFSICVALALVYSMIVCVFLRERFRLFMATAVFLAISHLLFFCIIMQNHTLLNCFP